MQFAPCGGSDLRQALNVTLVDEKQVMLGPAIRVHIFRQDPIAAGSKNWFFVIAREIFWAKRAYAVRNDFFDNVFIGIIRPGAGIAEIYK